MGVDQVDELEREREDVGGEPAADDLASSDVDANENASVWEQFLAGIRTPAVVPASRWRGPLDALLSLALIALHKLFAAPFLYAPLGFDEGYFLWEGWSLNRGMVPYRDFQEFKPPMVFVVNAIALRFGLTQMRYRTFFSAYSLAGYLALALALRSREVKRRVILAISIFFFALFFSHEMHESSIDDAESAALPLYLIGVSLLLYEGSLPRVRQVLAGVFLGLVPLTKEPLALVVLPTWLSFLALAGDASQGPVRPDARRGFALRTIGGVVGLLAVWVGYMLATHSLGAYVEQLRQNVVYVHTYAQSLNRSVDGVGSKLDKLREVFFNGAHLGALLPWFVCAFLASVRSTARVWAAFAAMMAFVASLYAVTVGGAFFGHYSLLALPGTYFFTVIGVVFVSDELRRYGPVHEGLALGLPIAACLLYAHSLRHDFMEMRAAQPIPPIVNRAQLGFIEEHTTRDDYIWTTGDPLLYVYSNRRSAVREPNVIDELIQMHPGATDEERLASERAELEEHLPKVIVLGDDPVQGYARKARYLQALVYPFLIDHKYESRENNVYLRPSP